ncbi:MAG: hypothetical protein QOK34_467 [Gaiellaceae bacterium]|nr:hypothetical protein [Gaiellaceae bacterium]
MATRLRDTRMRLLDDLRFEPTEKRVRAALGVDTVADTTRAVLVWEPRRVLPSYAVPMEDLRCDVAPSSAAPEDDDDPAENPILHGGFPFTVHSTEGEALSVRVGDETLEGAAFRPSDTDLAGLVVLDFHAFAWWEEDEPIVAHPRDPFHRVDIRRSSRQVRIEFDGELLAESSRPHLVFETSLPVRFYLPPDDLRFPVRPAEKRARCAYKGEAFYVSLELNGGVRSDLAWSYDNPLPDAAPLKGLVAFFDEKVDVTLDGEHRAHESEGIAATIVQEADA